MGLGSINELVEFVAVLVLMLANKWAITLYLAGYYL